MRPSSVSSSAARLATMMPDPLLGLEELLAVRGVEIVLRLRVVLLSRRVEELLGVVALDVGGVRVPLLLLKLLLEEELRDTPRAG